MDGNDMSYNTWVQQCQQTEGFGRVTVKDRMWISDIVCQVYLFPSDWNRTQEVPQTVSPPLMLPFHPNWLASFGLVSLQVQRPLNLLQCPWQHDRQILARCDLLCLTGNQTWGGDGRPWHLRNELVQPPVKNLMCSVENGLPAVYVVVWKAQVIEAALCLFPFYRPKKKVRT